MIPVIIVFKVSPVMLVLTVIAVILMMPVIAVIVVLPVMVVILVLKVSPMMRVGFYLCIYKCCYGVTFSKLQSEESGTLGTI